MSDDPHQDWLDKYHDGNCPVCGESFEAHTYQYPDSSVTINPDAEDGNVCVYGTLNSNSPDPALGIYRHPAEQWDDDT